MNKPKATCTPNYPAGELKFEFYTGECLVASLRELDNAIVERLAMHGLEQKLRDSYAGAEPEEAYGLAAKVWDRLLAGHWATPRSAGGSKGDILLRAMVELARRSGRPVDEARLRQKLESLSRSDRAKLRAMPQVAAIIAELRGPRHDVALEDLLA